MILRGPDTILYMSSLNGISQMDLIFQAALRDICQYLLSME